MRSEVADRRIPSLDGLRALSIFLVILEHTATNTSGPGETPGLLASLAVGNAAVGVSIFFVISGYLISKLLLGELDQTGDLSLARFYERRAFRILPAFYAYMTVVVVLGAVGSIPVDRSDALIAGSFLWNYLPSKSAWPASWWFAHSWSLSVEDHFYLLWPAALLFLGRRRAGWLCLGLILGVPLIRVGSYFALPSQRGHLGMLLHTRVDTLMFGCGLALVESTAVFRQIWRWIVSHRMPVMAAA